MNEITIQNPSNLTPSSGNKDTRLTLLEELKLKFESRSKFLKSAEIPSCTSPQLERSVGTVYIDDNQKFIDGALMSENPISNTTTDISEIDNDQLEDELIPELELNDPFREEFADDVNSNNKNKESPRSLLNVDNVWDIGESVLVQGRPALKSLWEELMKERNEHHKTAYTLESLQKMYYTELQKNATLQNNIDKLRFLGGSSPTIFVKPEPEPVLSQFKKPFEKVTNVTEKHFEDETISSASFSTTSSQRKLKFKRITESSESLFDFTNLISPKTSANLQLNNHFDVSPSKDQVDSFKSEKFNKSSQVSSQSFNKTKNSDKQPTDKEMVFSVGEIDKVDNFGLITNHKLDDLSYPNPNLGSVKTYSLSNDEQPVQEIKRKITKSKNEYVAATNMEGSFQNLSNTSKPGGTEINDLKQANILRLYKALELADQQSSFLRRRSREMLSYVTRLNINEKR